ncbi:putative polysaccharide deacetylase [Protomyces lactucae-debilis]|uniref:chitin deacetylase n=1 Tax=Protomyces lactucae-debilis TaxID=2754530 RepID=A0A1Y2FK51_PROLT|nr:putative polysaccharide deacetylase [Protomyces lactucae-debilis]ORY83165.1 putative polysaccharide deacetylase [Protomyces lactucae-debilis]
MIFSAFPRIPCTSRRRRKARMFSFLVIFLVTLLLILPFYCIYKPPSIIFSYLERRFPDVLFRVSTNGQKLVALTIDDAPSIQTLAVLKLLQQHNASATFFIIGSQVPGNEDLLRQVISTGNELGNHAMNDEPSRDLSDAVLTQQLKAVDKQISDVYQSAKLERPPTRYFRPGSGFFSTRMLAVTRSLNLKLVLGNVYPHDPQIAFPRINARHILSMVKPGSIIICHDRRSWTAPMLARVLPALTQRGYKVVTLSKLLEAQET